jgi:hypothetical protein
MLSLWLLIVERMYFIISSEECTVKLHLLFLTHVIEREIVKLFKCGPCTYQLIKFSPVLRFNYFIMKPILLSLHKNFVPDGWQPVGQGSVSLA